jgi:hypothetical protein
MHQLASICPLLILQGAVERGAKRVRVHILTDGRDVPDGSSLKFVGQLEKDLAEINASKVSQGQSLISSKISGSNEADDSAQKTMSVYKSQLPDVAGFLLEWRYSDAGS